MTTKRAVDLWSFHAPVRLDGGIQIQTAIPGDKGVARIEVFDSGMVRLIMENHRNVLVFGQNFGYEATEPDPAVEAELEQERREQAGITVADLKERYGKKK